MLQLVRKSEAGSSCECFFSFRLYYYCYIIIITIMVWIMRNSMIVVMYNECCNITMENSPVRILNVCVYERLGVWIRETLHVSTITIDCIMCARASD